MIKPTKRKAFNFLRSYFDVFNELENDKDRLNFLTSIINKQFLDEDPKNLNFLVNLCYESQRHSIETSVKGWKRATNDTLGIDPSTPLGTTLPTNPKEEEEKGEEEEEKVIPREKKFDIFWKVYPKKVAKDKCKSKFMKLPESDIEKIKDTIRDFIAYKPFADYTHPNPFTYLNQKRWEDVITPKEVERTKQEIYEEQLREVLKNKKQ